MNKLKLIKTKKCAAIYVFYFFALFIYLNSYYIESLMMMMNKQDSKLMGIFSRKFLYSIKQKLDIHIIKKKKKKREEKLITQNFCFIFWEIQY